MRTLAAAVRAYDMSRMIRTAEPAIIWDSHLVLICCITSYYSEWSFSGSHWAMARLRLCRNMLSPMYCMYRWLTDTHLENLVKCQMKWVQVCSHSVSSRYNMTIRCSSKLDILLQEGGDPQRIPQLHSWLAASWANHFGPQHNTRTFTDEFMWDLKHLQSSIYHKHSLYLTLKSDLKTLRCYISLLHLITSHLLQGCGCWWTITVLESCDIITFF